MKGTSLEMAMIQYMAFVRSKSLQIAIYTLSAALGALTFLYPSPSIEGAIGSAFTYVYALFILIGSLGVLIGIIMPNFKVELAFLWIVAGGFVCYDVALWQILVDRLSTPQFDSDMNLLAAPYGPAVAVAMIPLAMLSKILYLIRQSNALIKVADNGVG